MSSKFWAILVAFMQGKFLDLQPSPALDLANNFRKVFSTRKR